MSEDDTWDLTPGQYNLLLEHHNEKKQAENALEIARRDAEDRRTAQVCAVLANIHRGKNQKKFKIKDFMPQYKGIVKKQQTVAEQKAILLKNL